MMLLQLYPKNLSIFETRTGGRIVENIEKAEKIANLSGKAITGASSVLNWFAKPKEEARSELIKLLEKADLPPDEMIALVYNSRKIVREYANSRTILEQAKEHFKNRIDDHAVDDDWLHFFFDKAQKVSSKGMQFIWAQLLAGEFNKPGSISRKLMHIISIMDANSAISFKTFSYYIFERQTMTVASYGTEAALIPNGFYTNAFDFLLTVEKWLCEAGYADYKDLAQNLTMTTGELNSLENLGLIQKVNDSSCGIPLRYSLPENKMALFTPQDNSEFPLGQYSLTSEGQQLYQIIGGAGDQAVFEIIVRYLKLLNISFTVDMF